MSALENQHLEFIFGTRDGDHIRFEVLGLTRPDSDTDWYRSQLDTEIHINIGTFHGYRSLVMFSDDFHLFHAALTKLLSGETHVATLETGDFLSVDVCEDERSFNVGMQLDALEHDGEHVLKNGGTENWEWRLSMDRASLDALFNAVRSISDRYPTLSIPKH